MHIGQPDKLGLVENSARCHDRVVPNHARVINNMPAHGMLLVSMRTDKGHFNGCGLRIETLLRSDLNTRVNRRGRESQGGRPTGAPQDRKHARAIKQSVRPLLELGGYHVKVRSDSINCIVIQQRDLSGLLHDTALSMFAKSEVRQRAKRSVQLRKEAPN